MQNISQGRVATRLKCCGIFGGNFIINFLLIWKNGRIFNVGHNLAKLRQWQTRVDTYDCKPAFTPHSTPRCVYSRTQHNARQRTAAHSVRTLPQRWDSAHFTLAQRYCQSTERTKLFSRNTAPFLILSCIRLLKLLCAFWQFLPRAYSAHTLFLGVYFLFCFVIVSLSLYYLSR